MSDLQAIANPNATREKMELNCDHICLLRDDHVEQGTLHFYGYELPSSRKLARERLRLTETCGTCGGSGEVLHDGIHADQCSKCWNGLVFPKALIQTLRQTETNEDDWPYQILAAVVSYIEEGEKG